MDSHGGGVGHSCSGVIRYPVKLVGGTRLRHSYVQKSTTPQDGPYWIGTLNPW